MSSGNQPTLALLKSLKIGMWTAKNDQNWLLILPKSSIFVFIVEKGGHTQHRRFSTSKFFKQLRNSSPFSSTQYKDSDGCVFAFEVDCDKISGIDYSHPLVRDGRLALEANQILRREFTKIEDLLDFYSGSAPFGGEATPASLEMLFGTSPTKRRPSSESLSLFTSTPKQSTSTPESPELRQGQLKARTNLLNRISASMTVGQQDAVMFLARRSMDAFTFSSAEVAGWNGSMSPSLSASPREIQHRRQVDASSKPMKQGSRDSSPILFPSATHSIGGDAADNETPRFSSDTVNLISKNDAQLRIPHASTHTTENDESMMMDDAPLDAEEYFSDASETVHQHQHSSQNHSAAGYTTTLRSSNSKGQLVDRKRKRISVDIAASPSNTSEHEMIYESGSMRASTKTTKIYDFRLITAFFDDPHLPIALRPVIENNERLLKLYESGLPSWTIFLPSYGFYYRPWLRNITWVLFYAFSVFSLAIGFWDLYKTLPGLQLLLNKVAASVWLPPAAFLQWIETHAQIRLSILLTYMFGKSEMLVYILRMSSMTWRNIRIASEPMIAAFAPVAACVSRCVMAARYGVTTVIYAGISPLLMAIEAVYSAFLYPFSMLFLAFKQLHAAISVFLLGLLGAGGSLLSGMTTVATAAKAGRTVAQASPSALSWFASLDAFETVRASLVRAARSFQSVWRFIMHVSSATVRHRLTLSRRGMRAWRRVKSRLHGAIMVPVNAVIFVLKWMLIGMHVVLGSDGMHGQNISVVSVAKDHLGDLPGAEEKENAVDDDLYGSGSDLYGNDNEEDKKDR